MEELNDYDNCDENSIYAKNLKMEVDFQLIEE